MADYDMNDNQTSSPFDAIVNPLAHAGVDPEYARMHPDIIPTMMRGVPRSQAAQSNETSSAPTPASPNPASPSPAVPASVSPSGTSGSNFFQQGMEGQLRNAQAAEKTVSKMGDPTDELAKEQALAEKIRAESMPVNPRDAQGKVLHGGTDAQGNPLPNYRPSVGQRIMRGIQGFERGGIAGAIAAPYGDPSKQYERDVAQRQATAAADTGSLNEMARRFKESSDRMSALSKEQRDVSTAYKDVTSGQTAEEAAQNKGTVEQAQAILDREKAGWGPGGGKAPTTAEGVVARSAMLLYPDDPAAQVKYVRDNQFMDANTAGRMAEAQARLAEATANAAARRDDAAANRANQAFMRYQSQLATHGAKMSAIDTKTQDKWKTFQNDYDNELYGKVDSSTGERTGGVADKKDTDPDKQRVVNKYAQQRAALQKSIDDEYARNPEPVAPPELSGPAQSPAAPATQGVAPTTPPRAQGGNQQKAQTAPKITQFPTKALVGGKEVTVTGINPKTGKYIVQ